MENGFIYCPNCGNKTPRENYCMKCGEAIEIFGEKEDNDVKGEELIITSIIVSQTGKRLADPKTLYFTTNHILKDKCSRSSFSGKNMNMKELVKHECNVELNDPININEIQEKYPEIEIISYDEIEKAELSNNFWNTFLEITTTTSTSKYVLAGKKFKKNYLELFERILEPKIGDRFQVK